MRIGILGINCKLANLQLRERLAKACQKHFYSQNAVHGSHSIVLLSTCNRTELYFCSDDLAITHTYILSILRQEVNEEFDQKLYTYFGEDCFLHLCRVTTGLDSAILGETEIQGQVKCAYERVTEFIALPKELHYLFQKALSVGKKARSLRIVQGDLAGIEHAVFKTGKEQFKNLEDVKILFVGASEINNKVILYFKENHLQHITLCNRTTAAAKAMIETHRLKFLDWKSINSWTDYDWIIFGTKSNDFLLTKSSLHLPFQCSKLLIDLSVPRNIDPQIDEDSRISLFNIDQLNSSLTERRQQMSHFLGSAEQLVQKFTATHTDLFLQKQRKTFVKAREDISISL
ncbi:MAG: glutamyl-tRNA reductase [Parachlamydiaceae bacterium]|nr:glutamyl-tRNA reductase [Parachlamydiaceae bacterium]